MPIPSAKLGNSHRFTSRTVPNPTLHIFTTVGDTGAAGISVVRWQLTQTEGMREGPTYGTSLASWPLARKPERRWVGFAFPRDNRPLRQGHLLYSTLSVTVINYLGSGKPRTLGRGEEKSLSALVTSAESISACRSALGRHRWPLFCALIASLLFPDRPNTCCSAIGADLLP